MTEEEWANVGPADIVRNVATDGAVSVACDLWYMAEWQGKSNPDWKMEKLIEAVEKVYRNNIN